jgi:hypothetical protein
MASTGDSPYLFLWSRWHDHLPGATPKALVLMAIDLRAVEEEAKASQSAFGKTLRRAGLRGSQVSITMRLDARLPGAEHTFSFRLGSAHRASYGQYLPQRCGCHNAPRLDSFARTGKGREGKCASAACRFIAAAACVRKLPRCRSSSSVVTT